MMRCPACGNENPPEYPPDEYPFCIECGAQLGPFRQPQQGPYGPPPGDPYGGGQYGGPGQGGPGPGGPPPYGAPPDPYGNPQHDPYGRPPIDPYGGGQPGGGQPGGPYPGGPAPGPGGMPPGGPYGAPPPGSPFPGGPYGPEPGGPGPDYGPPPSPYGPGPQQPFGGREDTPQMPGLSGAARLILESGAGKVEYPLDSPVITIGRSRSNDISLEDARVSRHHARVVHDDRGYIIEDLNSRNGTRVDDRAVRDGVPLVEGAVIRIGDAVFRFTMTSRPGYGPGMAPGAGMPPGPGGPGSMPGPGGAPGPSGWGSGPGMGPAGGGPAAPVVYMSPWNPLQCPNCQGLRTMIQIVYGPGAATPGARTAAMRGEIILGEGPGRPDSPNAECRGCGQRVRIVQSGG